MKTKQITLSQSSVSRRILYAVSCIIILLAGHRGWCKMHEWRTINQMETAARQQYVDFDVSMNLDAYKQLPALQQPAIQQLINISRQLYHKNNLAAQSPSVTPKIPKIIHHVWLGSKLPAEYEGYYHTWRVLHPDWVFVFWTDNPANYDKGAVVLNSFKELDQKLAMRAEAEKTFVMNVNGLQFDNRGFYDETPFFGERSDILKWEIVHRHGGVYIDTDFECLKPLDMLHHIYDLYTGIQPLDTAFPGQLGAGIFAAKPHHPVMKQCVVRLKDGRERVQIIDRSGPLHFTRVFAEMAGVDGVDIAFPVSYFYPCTYEQRGMPAQAWIRPESFAVHHWAGSWLKPEAVVSNTAVHEYVMKQVSAPIRSPRRVS